MTNPLIHTSLSISSVSNLGISDAHFREANEETAHLRGLNHAY
jgi:hypothetical protein